MKTFDWNNATPEQKNLWRHASGLLVGVQTITPIYFQGAIAASEFLTYNAKKIYIALEVGASYSSSAGSGYLWFYNEANVMSGNLQNNSIAYNTTTITMVSQSNSVRNVNVYFGRVAVQVYDLFFFNGYKITIP